MLSQQIKKLNLEILNFDFVCIFKMSYFHCDQFRVNLPRAVNTEVYSLCEAPFRYSMDFPPHTDSSFHPFLKYWVNVYQRYIGDKNSRSKSIKCYYSNWDLTSSTDRSSCSQLEKHLRTVCPAFSGNNDGKQFQCKITLENVFDHMMMMIIRAVIIIDDHVMMITRAVIRGAVARVVAGKNALIHHHGGLHPTQPSTSTPTSSSSSSSL